MTDRIEPDVFRSSRARARKTHRCCECQRERILPGMVYCISEARNVATRRTWGTVG